MPPCSACGLNEPGTRFCRRCGASLRLDAARIGSAGNRNAFELALAERKRLRMITAACTGALVVMLGAGAWWYSSGSTSQATDEFPSAGSTNLDPVDLPAPAPEGGGDLWHPLAQVPPEPQAVSQPPAPSHAQVSGPAQRTPEPTVPSSPPPAPTPVSSRLQGVQAAVDEGQLQEPAIAVEPIELAAVPEPLAPPLVFPTGLQFAVRLLEKLSSKTAQVEDRFEAVTISDVELPDGGAVLPSGSVVRGVVVSVAPGTRTNRTARLTVTFDQITVDGRSYPIRGNAEEIVGPGLKGEVKRVGIGAGIGAVLGGIFGGAKGAAAGAAIGGGGTMAATEGQDVELDEGSVINVVLTQ